MKTHALVMVDAAGVIRVWSPGAEALFGYDEASAVGQTLDLIVPEDYRGRHWAGFRAAASSGTTKMDEPVANIPITCQDGSVVRFPGRLMVLRDAKNKIIGAMGIFTASAGADDNGLPNI